MSAEKDLQAPVVSGDSVARASIEALRKRRGFRPYHFTDYERNTGRPSIVWIDAMGGTETWERTTEPYVAKAMYRLKSEGGR